LALTNHTFGKTTGNIEYADMEINTGEHPFSTGETGEGIDLQAVITHEAGHFIGLAHSLENDSIMAEKYCESGHRCDKGTVAARRLAVDDILAVCTLYPPDGYTPPESDAPGIRCSESPGASPWNVLGGTGFVALGVLVARRRRRDT
jgi:MYXO-CTERM domain-containing protein